MKKRLLFIFIISTFVVGTIELIITGILELIAADFHVSQSLTGQLITIYALAFAIGSPILSKWTAHLERKTVLLSSLFIFIGGNIFSALSQSFVMLASARAVTALSAALFIVVTLSTTANLSDEENQGKTLGLVYMGFSSANVFGVPLGTFVGITFGWRATFWLITLLAVICFLLIVIFLPAIQGTTEKKKASFISLLKQREVTTLLMITTILLAAHYVVYSYISPIMTGEGYSLTTVSFILLLAGTAGTIGTGIGGKAADQVGPKRTIMAASLLFIISMLLLRTALPYFYLFTILVFIWNFVSWSTNPAIQTALIRINPNTSELALSLNMSALNIGIGLGALIGGLIVHNGGIHISPFIAAGMTLIPLFLLKWVSPR